jgi:hypothetical protein
MAPVLGVLKQAATPAELDAQFPANPFTPGPAAAAGDGFNPFGAMQRGVGALNEGIQGLGRGLAALPAPPPGAGPTSGPTPDVPWYQQAAASPWFPGGVALGGAALGGLMARKKRKLTGALLGGGLGLGAGLLGRHLLGKSQSTPPPAKVVTAAWRGRVKTAANYGEIAGQMHRQKALASQANPISNHLGTGMAAHQLDAGGGGNIGGLTAPPDLNAMAAAARPPAARTPYGSTRPRIAAANAAARSANQGAMNSWRDDQITAGQQSGRNPGFVAALQAGRDYDNFRATAGSDHPSPPPVGAVPPATKPPTQASGAPTPMAGPALNAAPQPAGLPGRPGALTVPPAPASMARATPPAVRGGPLPPEIPVNAGGTMADFIASTGQRMDRRADNGLVPGGLGPIRPGLKPLPPIPDMSNAGWAAWKASQPAFAAAPRSTPAPAPAPTPPPALPKLPTNVGGPTPASLPTNVWAQGPTPGQLPTNVWGPGPTPNLLPRNVWGPGPTPAGLPEDPFAPSGPTPTPLSTSPLLAQKQGMAKRAVGPRIPGTTDANPAPTPPSPLSPRFAGAGLLPIQPPRPTTSAKATPTATVARPQATIPLGTVAARTQKQGKFDPVHRSLSPEERAEVEAAEGRMIPSLFQGYGTPLPEMMSSPGWSGAGGAALGGLVGGGLGLGLGGGPVGAGLGGLAGAGLGGLLGYQGRQASNAGVVDLMRRLPPGATRRDYLADQAVAGDLNRATWSGMGHDIGGALMARDKMGSARSTHPSIRAQATSYIAQFTHLVKRATPSPLIQQALQANPALIPRPAAAPALRHRALGAPGSPQAGPPANPALGAALGPRLPSGPISGLAVPGAIKTSAVVGRLRKLAALKVDDTDSGQDLPQDGPPSDAETVPTGSGLDPQAPTPSGADTGGSAGGGGDQGPPKPEDVNLREATAAAQACAACGNFDGQGCQLLQMPVQPTQTCDAFAPSPAMAGIDPGAVMAPALAAQPLPKTAGMRPFPYRGRAHEKRGEEPGGLVGAAPNIPPVAADPVAVGPEASAPFGGAAVNGQPAPVPQPKIPEPSWLDKTRTFGRRAIKHIGDHPLEYGLGAAGVGLGLGGLAALHNQPPPLTEDERRRRLARLIEAEATGKEAAAGTVMLGAMGSRLTGAAAGAAYGRHRAPETHKSEGAARGMLYGGNIATGGLGGALAGGLGGGLLSGHLPESVRPWAVPVGAGLGAFAGGLGGHGLTRWALGEPSWKHKGEEPKEHEKGHRKAGMDKAAIGTMPLVFGSMLGGGALGAPLGALMAPPGHRWEGAGRGLGSGLMTGGLGGALANNMGIVGGLPGAIADDPAGEILGQGVGLGAGGLLGGMLGHGMGESMMGRPSWERAGPGHKPKHEEHEKEGHYPGCKSSRKAQARQRKKKQGRVRRKHASARLVGELLGVIKHAAAVKCGCGCADCAACGSGPGRPRVKVVHGPEVRTGGGRFAWKGRGATSVKDDPMYEHFGTKAGALGVLAGRQVPARGA